MKFVIVGTQTKKHQNGSSTLTPLINCSSDSYFDNNQIVRLMSTNDENDRDDSTSTMDTSRKIDEHTSPQLSNIFFFFNIITMIFYYNKLLKKMY